MPETSPDPLDAVRDRLLAAERVVVTSHIRPDGDALGSEIALARWLRTLGKEAVVLNADAAPRPLDWLMDEQPKGLVVKHEEGSLKQAAALAAADAIVVVDTGAGHRLGAVEARIKGALAPKLLIDHHPAPEPWFDLACVRTDAAATAEIVYDLIAGHDPALIDAAIATALYVGIVTDTGSFRYSATTPRTHRIVADLLERGGIQAEPIHIAVYDGRTREGLRLLARALDTIATHYGGRLATMYVTQDMLRESGAYFDETEGLIGYALSLDGVVAAVIFLETPSAVKLSFRSKGDCPINAWAARFGGGGHPNAAGAYITGKTLNHVMREVINAAPLHVAAEEVSEEPQELTPEDLALLASFKGKL
ncbi:MAG TPA: bifunctional oligoribonuclease/PAP phosphatase NrnA [Rubricoccaceae bacterium]|nr:bifunctional oligoribonuclease/PAP phosphatase NrnA [Rubricoccaceae bacterium]